jgi:hypothetical protein
MLSRLRPFQVRVTPHASQQATVERLMVAEGATCSAVVHRLIDEALRARARELASGRSVPAP